MIHSDPTIDFSLLEDYPTRFEAIKGVLNLTKSQIKKFHLSKKWLDGEVHKGSEISLSVDLVNRGVINPDYQGVEIPIIYEDDQLVALNKPPGVHCHPLAYSETNNCLSYLRKIGRGELLQVNGDAYDRGLLYRLDNVTSGVLLYIKENQLYRKLRDNFFSLIKNKIYLAVVSGKCELSGDYSLPIRSSLAKGHLMKKTFKGDERGRVGKLSLESLLYDQKNDVTLVKVFLHTGLRHQIRLQLSDLGYPILGDELYGGRSSGRVYLHCYQYDVEIGGKVLSVKASLAESFDSIFDLDSCL